MTSLGSLPLLERAAFIRKLARPIGLLVNDARLSYTSRSLIIEYSLERHSACVSIAEEEILDACPVMGADLIAITLMNGKRYLRGQTIRGWLQDRDGIDWIGTPENENCGETEHERSERVGTQLIEAGEALLRRAQRVKR